MDGFPLILNCRFGSVGVGMLLESGEDLQNPSVQSDARHSSWGRRSGSWEIAPDVVAMNAAAAQNRSNNQ
ncbi:hypothetical protein C5167_002053 [Papaver somniferum]|uniref:Uncharacterized protein n=1 Tax=Papaver somniferum TaxID=3469 RepID=A0A4Y7KWX3_PAPSO|nr:hypothetical protein C5167_002053 [Papaver somniferum]